MFTHINSDCPLIPTALLNTWDTYDPCVIPWHSPPRMALTTARQSVFTAGCGGDGMAGRLPLSGGCVMILCCGTVISWWRHHMEPFSALLAFCAGNSPVTGEFPLQRLVTRSFDVFFYLRLNKRLSKQSWCWWLETSWRSLWRHRNVAANAWHIGTLRHDGNII